MDHSGRSPMTLIVASASSAAAAVVVRELWAPGTIASAALMPLLIAVFGELLHRPAYRLTHAARERLKSRPGISWRTIDQTARIPSRWQRVLGTAGAAFLIGSVVLTGWELLAHHSLASARDRTTLWGGTVPRRTDRKVRAPQTQTVPAVRAPAPRQRRTADSRKPAHRATTPSATTTSGSGRPATTTTTTPTTSAPAVTTNAPTTSAPAVTTTIPSATISTTPTSQPPPQP
jgi:hypothetical protein